MQRGFSPSRIHDAVVAMLLALHSPTSDVSLMYFSSRGFSSGRSRKRCSVERMWGVVWQIWAETEVREAGLG
jgi:hypothetical protein